MQMMHWKSASLTGRVASSRFCCLIASACCLAWKSLYCVPSSKSLKSITFVSSSFGLEYFGSLLTSRESLVGRPSLVLPEPLSFRFRSLVSGGISAGGDPVKSTTLDRLVVCPDAAALEDCGVADGRGGVKPKYSAKGSESASRNGFWPICGRSLAGADLGILFACWLLGGRRGVEPGG